MDDQISVVTCSTRSVFPILPPVMIAILPTTFAVASDKSRGIFSFLAHRRLPGSHTSTVLVLPSPAHPPTHYIELTVKHHGRERMARQEYGLAKHPFSRLSATSACGDKH